MNDYKNIINESDVEQKFIAKLLCEVYPNGLGYAQIDFSTKPDIRKLTIDKGDSKKLYYPDYVILIKGYPVMIIEAKHPQDKDIEEAFREARLYALELNSMYDNINPCKYIIATNYRETLVGLWDNGNPKIRLESNNLIPTDPLFNTLIEMVHKEALKLYATKMQKIVRGKRQYKKPVHSLGGKSSIDELVGHNSFGINLSLDYKYLFNPVTDAERVEIAKNAYVTSKKREAHVKPVDKLIRKAVPPSSRKLKTISNTKKPSEVIDVIDVNKKYHNELCLLIGSVGSGKSTFVDYLCNVALDIQTINRSEWLVINLNNAPVTSGKIYAWVVNEMLNKLQELNKKFDFNDFGFIKRVFKREIENIEKGPIVLFKEDKVKYNEKLYEEINRLYVDKDGYMRSIINYIYVKHGKLLVTVLDNSDKRSREEQLLMFEVANWLKTKYYTMVMLPLRDVTYDLYRSHPPLDTVIKDLVFRIDPPRLDAVIYERFKYALRVISDEQTDFTYELDNGVRVQCKREEVAHYLKSLISSLFQNGFFRRLIVGIAGRNIRKGLEIFLDICKSGHIQAGDLLQIRVSQGEYQIPTNQIMRIILRNTRRYYKDENSHLKNLFASDKEDLIPNPFIRMLILKWLLHKEGETIRTKQYYVLKDMIKELNAIGCDPIRVTKEVEELIKAECISAESQKEDNISINENLKITPCGRIHVDLLRNLSYLSAIAEDTWFNDSESANTIARNITSRKGKKYRSKQVAIENSRILVDYLKKWNKEYITPNPTAMLSQPIRELYDIKDIEEYIERYETDSKEYIDYKALKEQYKKGTCTEVQVASIQTYGCFVEFGLNGTAFVPRSNYGQYRLDEIENGDWMIGEIIYFSEEHKRFNIKFISRKE